MSDEKATYTVSGPEAVLQKRYGEDIEIIRRVIEAAIEVGYLRSEHDGQEYICAQVSVEEDLRELFRKMYESAGWRAVSFRYQEQVRLYPPLPT